MHGSHSLTPVFTHTCSMLRHPHPTGSQTPDLRIHQLPRQHYHWSQLLFVYHLILWRAHSCVFFPTEESSAYPDFCKKEFFTFNLLFTFLLRLFFLSLVPFPHHLFIRISHSFRLIPPPLLIVMTDNNTTTSSQK